MKGSKEYRTLLLDTILDYAKQETGADFEKEYRFHPVRRWRFDAAFPDKMAALEIEGGVWVYGRHNRASTFENDMDKYNEAAILGWAVIRTTWEKLEDWSIFPKLVRAIKRYD